VRRLAPAEVHHAKGEVVINQALARRLWPDRDALGARLRLGDGKDAEWLTVVGVAGDVRMPGAATELFGLQMYRPTSAAPSCSRRWGCSGSSRTPWPGARARSASGWR